MAGKKDGATDRAGWDAAAKASAEREASEAPKKRGRPKKGEQTRLRVDARDAVHIKAVHEIPRPMSEEAFRIAAAESARQHNKITRIEKEIRDFSHARRKDEESGADLPSRKDEIKVLRETSAKLDREIEAESHLIETPCIEVHDVNRRTVTVYADVEGSLGVEVKAPRPMTDLEFERASKGTPFEPAAPLDAPEGGQEEAP